MNAQRRRNLQAQLETLEQERADVENEMATASLAAMNGLSAKLSRIETRIDEAKDELAALDPVDPMEESYRRSVNLLNQWMGSLQGRMAKLEERLAQIAERLEQLDRSVTGLHTITMALAVLTTILIVSVVAVIIAELTIWR